MCDNHFIFKGYRIGFYNFRLALRTLFMLHNETANVWSHIIGVVICLGFLIYTLIFVGSNASDQHRLIQAEISKLEMTPNIKE